MTGQIEKNSLDYLDWVDEEEKTDWVAIGLNAIIIVLGIITSYLLLLKIFGHSPVTEVVIGAAATIIGSGILLLYKESGRFNEFMQTTKNSFAAIKQDVKEVLLEQRKTSGELNVLKADMKIVRSELKRLNPKSA